MKYLNDDEKGGFFGGEKSVRRLCTGVRKSDVCGEKKRKEKERKKKGHCCGKKASQKYLKKKQIRKKGSVEGIFCWCGPGFDKSKSRERRKSPQQAAGEDKLEQHEKEEGHPPGGKVL